MLQLAVVVRLDEFANTSPIASPSAKRQLDLAHCLTSDIEVMQGGPLSITGQALAGASDEAPWIALCMGFAARGLFLGVGGRPAVDRPPGQRGYLGHLEPQRLPWIAEGYDGGADRAGALGGGDSRLGNTAWRGIDSEIIGAVSTDVLKRTFTRARPRDSNDPNDFFAGDSNRSFPSGEAAEAASIVTPYMLEYGKDDPAVYALSIIPLYVGIGRVKAQAHWQSDVVAGWAVGGLAGWYAHERDQPLVLQLMPHGIYIGLKKASDRKRHSTMRRTMRTHHTLAIGTYLLAIAIALVAACADASKKVTTLPTQTAPSRANETRRTVVLFRIAVDEDGKSVPGIPSTAPRWKWHYRVNIGGADKPLDSDTAFAAGQIDAATGAAGCGI